MTARPAAARIGAARPAAGARATRPPGAFGPAGRARAGAPRATGGRGRCAVMRDRDRQRENRRVFAGGAVVAAAVVAWLVLGALRRPEDPGVPFVAATATAVVSDQAKAEAAALLDAAVLSFAEGHLGTALELSEQALGKWPQYEAAQRFAATAVPQATAVEQSVQARATAAVLARAQAGEAARRVYSARAGLLLQRYTDALGVFRERHRQARERPELLRDAEWRGAPGGPGHHAGRRRRAHRAGAGAPGHGRRGGALRPARRRDGAAGARPRPRARRRRPGGRPLPRRPAGPRQRPARPSQRRAPPGGAGGAAGAGGPRAAPAAGAGAPERAGDAGTAASPPERRTACRP